MIVKFRGERYEVSFLPMLNRFIDGVCWGAGAILCALALLSLSRCAQAAPIPQAALQHKATLIRAARYEFGLEAPVALLAAQVHTESRWRENAVSPAGAQGLAQFMPSTARWLPQVAPHTGEPMPNNPGWALRAMCAYDKYLLTHMRAADTCNHWAKALSAYNGGYGWVLKDQRLAAARGLDPALWWDNVETVNAGRSAANWRENREYPRRIFALQGTYEAAGWGEGVHCD